MTRRPESEMASAEGELALDGAMKRVTGIDFPKKEYGNTKKYVYDAETNGFILRKSMNQRRWRRIKRFRQEAIPLTDVIQPQLQNETGMFTLRKPETAEEKPVSVGIPQLRS